MTTIITKAGRAVHLPDALDHNRVAGIDIEGRIVVDDFDARNAEPSAVLGTPFMFGLTLCCNASDKGYEDGVFCRACAGGKPNADEGNYLFRQQDGTFPGLDPLDHFED